MSGMGDGYVGTAQDAARIRRLEKQRELERKRIQDLKKKSAEGQSGLLQFGSGTSEVSMLSSLPYLSLATKKSYYQSFMNIFSPPNKSVFTGDFLCLLLLFPGRGMESSNKSILAAFFLQVFLFHVVSIVRFV